MNRRDVLLKQRKIPNATKNTSLHSVGGKIGALNTLRILKDALIPK